jgi:hypothetical protein
MPAVKPGRVKNFSERNGKKLKCAINTREVNEMDARSRAASAARERSA